MLRDPILERVREGERERENKRNRLKSIYVFNSLKEKGREERGITVEGQKNSASGRIASHIFLRAWSHSSVESAPCIHAWGHAVCCSRAPMCVRGRLQRGRSNVVKRFKCHTTRRCYTPGYYYSTCLISKCVSHAARGAIARNAHGIREKRKKRERERVPGAVISSKACINLRYAK